MYFFFMLRLGKSQNQSFYTRVGGGQNREAITACEDTCELFSSTLRCNRRILILKMKLLLFSQA